MPCLVWSGAGGHSSEVLGFIKGFTQLVQDTSELVGGEGSKPWHAKQCLL